MGGSFFDPPPTPPPPPPLPQNLKKVGFKWGGSGGVRTKNSLGDAIIGQNNDLMILQGVKLTIPPLGVGYANSLKMAKMGGYVAFSPYIRLPGFDLTTSAR